MPRLKTNVKFIFLIFLPFEAVKVSFREDWMIGPKLLAVVWFDSTPAPSPPSPLSKQVASLSPSNYVSPVQLTLWRGGEGGWAWIRIIRQQESLALSKSFNPPLVSLQKQMTFCSGGRGGPPGGGPRRRFGGFSGGQGGAAGPPPMAGGGGWG